MVVSSNAFADTNNYKSISKIEMDVLRNDKVIGYSNYFFKSNIPMVGASGAVFGILLAFAMLFPNMQLMLLHLGLLHVVNYIH